MSRRAPALRLVEWFSVRRSLASTFSHGAAVGGVSRRNVVLRSRRGDAELRRAAPRDRRHCRAHLATLLIAGATLVAGAILAIVPARVTD